MQKVVTQIAAGATEQSYSAQSVSASVCEIASIIQRTAASAQESVAACQQIAILTTELAGPVGSFKLGLA